MTTSDIIRRAGKNLRQAKGRTLLTSLAIAVGATTITLAMAAGAGGRDYAQKEMDMRGVGDAAWIQVYRPSSPSTSDSNRPDVSGVREYQEQEDTTQQDQNNDQTRNYDEPLLLTTADQQKIATLQGVKQVIAPLDITGNYLKLANQDRRFVLDSLGDTAGAPLPEQEVTNLDSNTIPQGQILITYNYAEAFNLSPASLLGQKVVIGYRDKNDQPQSLEVTIAAIGKKPFSPDDNSAYAIISRADAEKMFISQTGPLDQVKSHNLTILPQPNADLNQLKLELSELGFEAYSSEDMQQAFMEAINVVQWGLVGFGALALLASIFGIINTQYISVLERTQQIGLMRAVGASRKDIGRLFRYEAAWIGFLGALLGILVALACKLAEPLVKGLLDMPDDFTILIYEPLTLAAIVALLMIVAVVAGFFPSRRAAKLDPIEALRTE